ncbi:hypothetical protein Dda_1125 [Drechslerella dactyloides]|uniref:Uncharacterized protein n=1 Tax=Drechslerella dactyloides TaxID=74499 RepID=A0AAD6NMQ4_DREDA|nr:hypothetical protein Dda_1125 [Drechslerella dactyloides]
MTPVGSKRQAGSDIPAPAWRQSVHGTAVAVDGGSGRRSDLTIYPVDWSLAHRVGREERTPGCKQATSDDRGRNPKSEDAVDPKRLL